MDTTKNLSLKKKELEHGSEKSSQGKHTEDSKKVKRFEFHDSEHTQQWAIDQIEKYRRKNAVFSAADLLISLNKKITIYSSEDIFIDHDELCILDGMIYALPPDLKNLPEADPDSLEYKKAEREQAERILQLYGKLTSEEFEFMYTRRQELQKKFPNKSVVELNKTALAEYRKK